VEPPPNACATWRRLYTNLQRFSLELGRHIQLENEVLFFNASQVAEGAHDA
jgi:regulator of cell morphogenesis and NO signaling